MATASTNTQNQGGSDVTLTKRAETVATSQRTEPATQIITKTESGEEVSRSVTGGSKTRTVQKERIGLAVSFTLKVTNTPPPQSLT